MRQFIDWNMRFTLLSEIQLHRGVVYRELFERELHTRTTIEFAIETHTLLLAFKRSNQEN